MGGSASHAKFLKIRIVEKGRDIVNVNLPIGLVKLITKHIPEAELREYGIDVDSVIKLVKEEAEGRIVDIYDETDQTKVEVYIE